MTDPTATDQIRFVYDLIGRYIQDPTTDLFAPIQEFANKADNPPLELLVLAAASIVAAAGIMVTASQGTERAVEQARNILLANDVNEIFRGMEGGDQ